MAMSNCAMAISSPGSRPPLAGWWEGADILERQALGLLDAAEADAALAARANERVRLMQALGEETARADAPFDAVLAAAQEPRLAAEAFLDAVRLCDPARDRQACPSPFPR